MRASGARSASTTARSLHEREPADTFLELHLAARQSQSSWQPARQQATRWSRRAVAAYCADLATFLAILHAQLPEAAHAEQQAQWRRCNAR